MQILIIVSFNGIEHSHKKTGTNI